MSAEHRPSEKQVSDKPTSYFRGYWSISEVVDYMKPLAEWMQKFKPESKKLTLKRQDYDLIRRWPKAAGLFGITVTETGASFMGFELGFDKKPPRYLK
jgi:hypothetical protein